MQKITTTVLVLGLFLLSIMACTVADDPEPSTNDQDSAEDQRIPASPKADDVQLLANVHFLRLREVMNYSMEALAEGELVLEDGCVRLKSVHGSNDLLIWPQRFKLSVEGGDIRISDDFGLSLSIGDEISIGGGQVPRDRAQTLVEHPIPEDCHGGHLWLIAEHPGYIQKLVGATSEDEDVDPATFDAMGYASHVGVSIEEAQRRLDLQSLAGYLDAELSAREGRTFAGLWIEHTPQYRIIVQFTQNAQETIALYVHNDELAEVIEVRTADASLAELREAQSEALEAIRAENILVESGIDIKANKVKIYVTERDLLDDAIGKGRIRLSDNVAIVTVPAMSQPDVDDWDLPPDIHFPQVREDGAVPTALLEGELTLEGGCLRVTRPSGFGHLLIWPQRFNLIVDGRDIRIIGDPGVSLSVGDEISIGGGEVPLRHLQTLVEEPIPSDCSGPYWLVGEVPTSPLVDP